jgi:MFS family permease
MESGIMTGNMNTLPERTEQVTAAQPDGIAATGRGWSPALAVRVLILMLAAEAGYMVFAYPTNALVQIATAFKTDQVAWVLTSFSLAAAVSAMLIGNLADRLGKRRILLATLLVVLIGLLISTFAPSFGVLVLGRVLQAPSLALPFLLPSLVRDVFPVKTVPFAVALVVSGAGIVSIFVTLSAGTVIETVGYRAVFWVPAILVALVMILVWLVVPESDVRAEKKPLDVLGALLLGAGVGVGLLGISLAPQWGWGSVRTILTIGVGFVLLVAWVVQSFRVRAPLIDLREFTHFPFLVTFLFSALGTTASVWFYFIANTVALTPAGNGWGLGLEPKQATLFTAIFTLGSFLGGIAVGRALMRIPVPTVGAFVQATLALGFLVAVFGLSNSVLFGIAALVVGAAAGGTYVVTFNLAILVVEVHKQATMTALVTVGANIGSAILPVALYTYLNSTSTLVAGAPLYSLGSMQVAMLVPAVMALIVLAFAVALRRSQHSREELLAGTRK